jgi:hypothetical protein
MTSPLTFQGEDSRRIDGTADARTSGMIGRKSRAEPQSHTCTQSASPLELPDHQIALVSLDW